MFSLDAEQQKKLVEWRKTLPDAYTGAAGGRFTYEFTPTSLGVVCVVKDFITGKEINLTDFESW